MVVAGNETTTKLLGNAVFHLTADPEQRDRGLRRPRRHRSVNAWIEETLRYDTSTQLLARLSGADLTLHGVTAPQGSKLVLCLGAANRDDRVFTDPETFDVDRDAERARAEPQLRRRPALLPRRQPGPAGGHGSRCARWCVARAASRPTTRSAVRFYSANVRGFAHLPVTVAGADGQVRPARSPTRRRHRCVPRGSAPPRRWHSAAAGHPGGPRRAPHRPVRRGRDPDPGRRWRGGSIVRSGSRAPRRDRRPAPPMAESLRSRGRGRRRRGSAASGARPTAEARATMTTSEVKCRLPARGRPRRVNEC